MELILEEISAADIINRMREFWGLPKSENSIDDTLLACCIRRVASFRCPCSYATLTKSIIDSFQGLVTTDELFRDTILQLINQLVTCGDLLELSDVSINEIYDKGTWLFMAAPAFLIRPNNDILLFGIVRDEIVPIPFLTGQIQYEGCKRFVVPDNAIELQERLKEFGVLELTESSWLKLPKQVKAFDYVTSMDKELLTAEPCNEITDLVIIDPALSNKNYKKRFTKPITHTGHFVARRPQEFGSPIWCYAELLNGVVKKFIDIPQKWNSITQRGCDGAWHLQLAIDTIQGQNQIFVVKDLGSSTQLNFFSPIPLWAERRLMAIGRSVKPDNCLFSYALSSGDAQTEITFLRDYLWLNQ